MNPPNKLHIAPADLADASQSRAVVELLDHYSQDVMGGTMPLTAEVRGVLAERLAAQAGCRVWLAYLEGVAVGVAVCFTGFSTFQARSLLNIHDLAVHASVRGQGIGRALLSAVEEAARELGYCKLTLEVRADNHGARYLYQSFGFDGGETPATAMAFLTKKLS